jgi:hypothetical protein
MEPNKERLAAPDKNINITKILVLLFSSKSDV